MCSRPCWRSKGRVPWRALQFAGQLQRWVERPDWTLILDSFSRCVRITRGTAPLETTRSDLLREAQERALYEALQAAAGAQAEDDVDSLLTAVESLVPTIRDFFDHVLVNVEDETLRRNRLALLRSVAALQTGLVDLSRLSGF